MKKISSLFLLLLFVACGPTKQNPEVPAQQLLNEARQLMQQQSYTAAKDTILTLRKKYPEALKARKAAILTLDSVELLATRDSLLAYELQFNAEKEAFAQMLPRQNGKTNQAYYDQQRLLFDMNNHYEELCAKVEFFVRKIAIDKGEKEEKE